MPEPHSVKFNEWEFGWLSSDTIKISEGVWQSSYSNSISDLRREASQFRADFFPSQESVETKERRIKAVADLDEKVRIPIPIPLQNPALLVIKSIDWILSFQSEQNW